MHKRDGFTIIELIVVIVIIAILVILGGLGWRLARDDALERKQQADVIRLKAAIEKYAVDHGEYPFPDTIPACKTVDDVDGNIERVCENGELSTVLVPKYIDAIPKDKNGNHIPYVAERPYYGSTPIAGTSDRDHWFGLKVPSKESKHGFCVAGSKKTKDTWWHVGAENRPRCNF